MVAHVGIDPRRDLQWVTRPSPEQIELLAQGKIDAMLAFPPDPLRLRDRKIGRMIVSSTFDRPWSQYFCCMLNGHRDFVARHPVAVKRAMRAILRASQMCAAEPDRVARQLADRGFSPRYEDSARTIRELPYDRWNRYDPEDTVRFYALRLHEAGLVKSTPRKLIAQGTDWRFLNELKREMKG
jgi:NitT/TauT family transport system substrate-binding protein